MSNLQSFSVHNVDSSEYATSSSNVDSMDDASSSYTSSFVAPNDRYLTTPYKRPTVSYSSNVVQFAPSIVSFDDIDPMSKLRRSLTSMSISIKSPAVSKQSILISKDRIKKTSPISVIISKRGVQKPSRHPFKRHTKWPQASIDSEHQNRRKLLQSQSDQRMVCFLFLFCFFYLSLLF